MSTAAPEATPVTGTPADCPSCGSPAGAFQEYCLECGSRLRADVRARDVATSWRSGGAVYGVEGVWVALAALVVAVLVTVAAVALTRDAGGSAQAAYTATLPQATPPTTEAAPPAAPTFAPAPPPPAATTAAAPPPPPPAPAGLTAWPAGRDGWTVVVASLAKQGGQAVAVERAKAAASAGVPDVGVIDTDAYASFHPGYFVVFSGIYGSRSAAEAAASAVHGKGYADAYPGQVAR